MNERERTLQQRDPLAAIVGRPTTYLAALGVPIYAGIMVWFNLDDLDDLGLAIASIFVIAMTGIVFAFASSPLRAPFTTRMLVVITLGGLVAHVLAAASMWESNAYVRDDWGPSALALYLLALAPYRPAREIAWAGVISAVLISVLTIWQSASFVTPVPVHLFMLAAVTPLLILSLGAALFAHELVGGLERWEQRATMSPSKLGDGKSEWIARSVQQDRITILNQEIVPYFSSLLASESVTPQDRERALELSGAIRAIMVAEMDRSWLDGALEDVGGSESPTRIDDDGRLADRMTADQRTVLRALLVALHSQPRFDQHSLRIEIEETEGGALVMMRAIIDASDHTMRNSLEPYFAIMRILFADLHVDHLQPVLTLRFSYGQ